LLQRLGKRVVYAFLQASFAGVEVQLLTILHFQRAYNYANGEVAIVAGSIQAQMGIVGVQQYMIWLLDL
jgi:hypothetical protein